MTELETALPRCNFPLWIRSLADDATALAQLLSDRTRCPRTREASSRGLNYVFKSLDLIPDGSRASASRMTRSCCAGGGLALSVPMPKTPTCARLEKLARRTPA